MPFSQKLLFNVKSHSLNAAHDQKTSLAQKNKFTLQFYSLSLLGQNIVWTNSTSGKKKNLKKTNTPLRVVKNLKKTNTPLRVVKTKRIPIIAPAIALRLLKTKIKFEHKNKKITTEKANFYSNTVLHFFTPLYFETRARDLTPKKLLAFRFIACSGAQISEDSSPIKCKCLEWQKARAPENCLAQLPALPLS